MPSSWLDPDLFAVLFLGFAAPLLGLVALLTRGGPQRRPWWAVAALAAGALAVGTALAGQPRGFWLPPAVLAALCAAFQALRSERLVRAAAFLLGLFRRPAVQAALLIVTGPVLAAGWVGWTLAGASTPWQLPPQLALEQPRLQADPSSQATTDAGRPMPLYHPADAPSPHEELAAADMAVVSARGLSGGLIRTGPASQDYNCHGWVFAGGRGWVEGVEVEQVLRDNGYYPVTAPRPGDLAIYRNSTGAVSHSGVVRAAWAGGIPLVESKWGEGGRFVSAANATPYGAPTYYRSPRDGHRLQGFGDNDAATTVLTE